MKLFATLIFSVAILVAPARAAEPGEEKDLTVWKWANFAVLAGVLYYYGGKFGTPYFGGKRDEIRSGLADAEKRSAEAEARMAEVNTRLGRLDGEIAEIRSSALLEQENHIAALRLRSALEVERARISAAQQIEAISKHAQHELEQYVTRLALALAEQRLRANMTPATQHALTAAFVRNLKN